MKIIFFSLLCLILIGITSYSYAQWMIVDKNTKLPEVLLQLELRDSNGNLVAYVEADQIRAIATLELNRFLDNQNQTRKEFLIKDDQKFEIQQWEVNGKTYFSKSAYSQTRLLDEYQNEFIILLDVRHDSYQTQPGDTLRVFWTVIRPVS